MGERAARFALQGIDEDKKSQMLTLQEQLKTKENISFT